MSGGRQRLSEVNQTEDVADVIFRGIAFENKPLLCENGAPHILDSIHFEQVYEGWGWGWHMSGGRQRMSSSDAHSFSPCSRKADIRIPGKENSNSHGARPVY